MIDRKAILLVCDEVMFSLTGKFNVFGIYTGEISIPQDPTSVSQLAFLFIIETDTQDLFQSLACEVTVPNLPSVRQDIPVPMNVTVVPGRPRLTIRWPIILPNLLLSPGAITSRVIHDKGEINTGGVFISVVQRPLPTKS